MIPVMSSHPLKHLVGRLREKEKERTVIAKVKARTGTATKAGKVAAKVGERLEKAIITTNSSSHNNLANGLRLVSVTTAVR